MIEINDHLYITFWKLSSNSAGHKLKLDGPDFIGKQTDILPIRIMRGSFGVTVLNDKIYKNYIKDILEQIKELETRFGMDDDENDDLEAQIDDLRFKRTDFIDSKIVWMFKEI